MIKKLKFKFIITNMLLVTVVMFTAFGILYFNSASELYDNSMSAMRDIAERKHGRLEYLFKPDHEGDDSHAYISTYTIDINEEKQSCVINGFGSIENLTEENLKYINTLINTVLSKDTSEGVLDEYNMRFLNVKQDDGTRRIVLLDKLYEDESLKQLLVSFAISGSVAFVAILIISILIAGVAVRPVERSMMQQKQLIADISHELKTPLTVIGTNTDIILSHADSDIQSETKWLGYIKDETNRMSELLNMMIYLAKSDEELEEQVLSDVKLSDAAFEIALPFESVCFERGKSFDFEIEPDIIVLGEESSIKQLILILLDNAVKYSNDGGSIKLIISEHGDKARISVFNTGEPINRDIIPRLFERFFRVDESRSRDKGGSGLGLSIAKRIIERNEASISVSSSIENGTMFSCDFKISKQKKKDSGKSSDLSENNNI